MSLGFGLLSAQRRAGESNWSRAYAETLRLTKDAERLGFSSIWTTEHHFVDDGYMPSLLAVSAAMAAVTETIEIGTGVVLAPLHHPLRLAEDAATVELISGGRLTLGLGLGWVEIEFEGLGAEMAKRGAAMDEMLRILPQAWSGEPFRHSGDVYDFPELAVRPTPQRKIPIIVGGGAEVAVRRAARLADGIFANAPVEKFLKMTEWVLDELDKADRDPGDFRVMHYSVILPGDSQEEAFERYLPHQWHMMWKYSDMEASATRSGPPPEPPPITDQARNAIRARSTIAGTADQIVEELLEVRQKAALEVEFAARSYFHTLPYEEQLELMEELATDVAPHL